MLHRAAPFERVDLVEVDRIRCTSLVRTVVDLGAVVADDLVEQAVDDALRRGVSLRGLRAAMERLDRPGPSGTARLRRVLGRPDRVGVVPDTWFERLVERLVGREGLPPPKRQYPVRRADGSVMARLDLAWPEVLLGLEAHSDRWHFGARRGRRDRVRDNALAAAGWELVYAAWDDLRGDGLLAQQVGDVYRRRLLDLRRAG
ncbi:MAG: hypothetical protein GEV08_18820 [Acidimicrobiia bacterium]|nr:hypothetical protein [Acidimicrobiia bacterium]